MGKYVVYSHEKNCPESSMVKICTCDTKDAADYVINALKYRDSGGREDHSGLYDYYTTEVK